MTRPSEDSTPPTPALLRFLERRFEDLAAGRRFDVDHYIALFPDIAEQIRNEWEKIEAPRPAIERGPAPGEDLGPYRIERRIGRGGFGVVYLAEDVRVHRPVAIKFLSSALATDGDAMVRFRREAEAIARLEHPAIGALYDASLEPPLPYLVMRYVEGEPLAARILAAKGTHAPLRLDPQNGDGVFTGLALFFATIARAIAIAHKAGVVHRDLKPGNIMVTPDGEPVVLDFGLARRTDDETLTRADEIIGTLAYMAPETIAGRPAGPAADIYAIGATLYECLALEKPFTASSSQALMRRIAEDEPPALKVRCPDIPGDLAAITMHALEKDPQRRYADADALADDLAAFAAGEDVSAKRPSTIARTLRRARRRPALTALCIFLAIGGPWAGYLWRTNRAQTPIVRAAAERERRESAERMIEDGFYRVGQWQCAEALPMFEAALRDLPEDVAALGGKTLALIILKRNDEALRFLDLARDRTARSPALRLLHDEAQAGATGAASRASAPEPGDQGAPIYYYFLGWTALRRGEAGDPEGYRDALRSFSDAVAASPSARAIFHFEWARAAGLAGDAESARRAAAAIRTLWPKSANGAFYAAFGLTGAGAYAEAVVEYRRALALEPKHRMAELGLGAALLCEKDFDAAIDLYKAILARDNNDWTAHQNIALAYVNRDDPNDRALALGHAEKAATLDPENAEAHDLYLRLLGEGGDAAKTLAELRRWAAVRPNDALALLNLAMELAERPDQSAKDESRALARRAKAAVEAGQNLPPAALEALDNLLR